MSKTDIQKNKNKTVVISGSTSGLGKEMSIEFAKRGWLVAGLGKTKAKVDEMTKIMGVKHQIKECDVSCNKSVKSFSENIIKKLGVPELLINNAAVMNAPKPLWEVPREEFDHLTHVNINGVANMIRHFLPSMLEKRQGMIINLSSGWGRSTSPDVAPYCATKWGVEGLTRSLAQELPQGLAAVAFNPGIINTDMLRSCFGDGASSHENPVDWAKHAVSRLEKIGLPDNSQTIIGQS